MSSIPQTAAILPNQHRELLNYLAAIRQTYWYIDFLDTGVEERERTATTPPSDRLFVLPTFAEQLIDPQGDEADWPKTHDLYDLMEREQVLFLLGDPGMGKTTLVRRISYTLSKAKAPAFTERYGSLVPFPLILRDLPLEGVESWDNLLEVFFEQPWLDGKKLPEPQLRLLFENGQAFVLLDGLDEIYAQAARQRLARIVQEGISRYPKARWWITSRIVGFDQALFWGEQAQPTATRRERHLAHLSILDTVDLPESRAKRYPEYYIAPFSQAQIATFTERWFSLYVPEPGRQKQQARQFIDALASHPSMAHLARIPILLTMMALYYRVNENFPDGRVQLYRSLTNAYLDKIVRRRQLRLQAGLSPQQQQQGLAALALAMQQERKQEDEQQQLTIDRATAERVFCQALPSCSQKQVSTFFDSLELKSELLVPKARGRYGFLHLSYQEFFAAEALRRQFDEQTAAWAGSEEREAFWETMRAYAQQSVWHETLVLFFETFFADWNPRVKVARYAFEQLFGEGGSNGLSGAGSRVLMAKLLTNEFIAAHLDSSLRTDLLDTLYINSIWNSPNLRMLLTSWGGKRGIYWSAGEDTTPPATFPEQIRWLELSTAQVADLGPLSSLTNLVSLDLSGTAITDLEPLSRLINLGYLDLRGTAVADLRPLSGLINLAYLDLSGTVVADLAPMSWLFDLKGLDLSGTPISDLTPLFRLTNLNHLDLSGTLVIDLGLLSRLTNLSHLYLKDTKVSDLTPLFRLTNLNHLDLSGTTVVDLGPLSDLVNLRGLDLSSTPISDLGPLSKLGDLMYLDLSSTAIADLRPLATLKHLSLLRLDSVAISPEAIAQLKSVLPRVKIFT